MKWLILTLGIVANASASIFIKIAMTPPRKPLNIHDPITTLTSNWPMLLGLFLYGMAFILYAAALTHLPLNVAHPILTAGAIASVAIMSVVIFNEPLNYTTLIGLGLIVSGVFLITANV